MRSKDISVWLFALVLLVGLTGVCQLQKRIDAQQKATRLEQDQLAIRSSKAIKRMSLEYAPLLGALYWTRAVQYYGEKHRLHLSNLELLWPLLDIATTLDPNLLIAYRFGSTFLAERSPTGAGRPDLAVELLERGVKANPMDWRLYQDMGNVYYFDAKDYPKAAAAYETGSRIPGALIWMKIMAAKIAAEGESPETSYFLWQQVYDNATDPLIKQNAGDHLKLMRAALDLKAIDHLADEYEKRTRRRATHISELVQAGLLPRVPRDPEGYPYVLGEGGKAELNLNSPMLEEMLVEKNFTPHS